MTELEAYGQEEGVQLAPGPVHGLPEEDALDRDRILTISYTSGTTGKLCLPHLELYSLDIV